MKHLENKYCNYIKRANVPKMKNIQFKVINNVYSVAEILQNERYRLRLEIFVYIFILLFVY